MGPSDRRLHPVSITRFPLTRFSPGAGLLRNPFVYTINAKIFQGLGPKRRESCNGDRVYRHGTVGPSAILYIHSYGIHIPMILDTFLYIYIPIFHIYIYIYIYIYSSDRLPPWYRRTVGYTVSFHNFKSQKIKLSVSNPKNTYVAYVSVLSQIFKLPGSRPQKQT